MTQNAKNFYKIKNSNVLYILFTQEINKKKVKKRFLQIKIIFDQFNQS